MVAAVEQALRMPTLMPGYLSDWSARLFPQSAGAQRKNHSGFRPLPPTQDATTVRSIATDFFAESVKSQPIMD